MHRKLLTITAPLLLASCISKPTEELHHIFDGDSLDGWKVFPASSSDAWSVQDGEILARGDGDRSYLVYEDRDLRDFEFQLEYRFEGKGNSGVSIRARRDPTGTRAWVAYHADLGHVGIGEGILGAWDFHTPWRSEHGCPRGSEALIGEDDKVTYSPLPDPVTAAELDAGGWNQLRIVARGNRLELFLNGRLSSAFTEELPLERRLTRGMLQLQLHDPDMTVRFRDIQLRRYFY